MRRVAAAALVFVLVAAGRPAGRQTAVDLQSLMTTPVWLFNGGREISQGTGFFYGNIRPDGKADAIFLVTNYHVVTGHPPLSNAPRSGDRIRFALHQDPEALEQFREYELPLYDVHDEPIWASSDVYPNADVVLVPLPPRIVPLYVFTEEHTRSDIKIRPTSGATLLGYPYGFFDRLHLLPIWKTGHVATEPDVDFEGEPAFLVDVSVFPGMSGSPVLAVATGIYESEDGTMRSGRIRKLLGIFSSMPVVHRTNAPAGASADGSPLPPTSSDISLQLGYVWKSALIADIARQYHPR
jgi:hypothetical protein